MESRLPPRSGGGCRGGDGPGGGRNYAGAGVVLVGHVAASEIYVRSKVKTCAELGLWSEMLTPPESVTTEELLETIAG